MNRFAPVSLAAFVLPLLFAASGGPVRGVPHFHYVNDNVLRGAQPTTLGLHSLAQHGVHTVLDLRAQSGWESAAARRSGLRFVHIPLNAHRTPAPEDLDKALATLEDLNDGPVFVHCEHGDDRTGLVIACYRIVHDHWTNRHALEEARSIAGRKLVSEMEDSILHFDPAKHPGRRVQK